MDDESRKARRERAEQGDITPEDASSIAGFWNRVRSHFSFVLGIDRSAPLDEVTLDGIQRAKSSIQEVQDIAGGAEDAIKSIILARAVVPDDLFVEGEAGALFLGLPTYDKRFVVDTPTPNVAWKQVVASLVRDGLVSADEVEARAAAYREGRDGLRLRYLARPKAKV